MGAEVLKKFGRYFLLDQLAQGGMAEINRARLASADGASRILVIKRIQAGFGGNNEFYQMFKSEIKVTMGFNHPNIVQLYDFGEEEGQPFIAMELVDGKNLRQFLSRFAEIKQNFPVELAAFVVEQAASGLHYAHFFRDKVSGEALNIVHRDISPQNILIAFEGSVKVIDFGIAKANSNSENTRAGVIKGKPSYLSPEQITGEVLDGRCDEFALGIVLWELLTGRKLFAGENDLAVLKLIEACSTHVKPPSTFNPKVPKELDYIVLKMLSKQREKRYQSCEEVQRALHKFLYSFAPDFNPGDLAYYAKDLFKNDIVEDRKRLQKLNEKVEALLSVQHTAVSSGGSSVAEAPIRSAPVERKQSSFTQMIEINKSAKQEKVEIEVSRPSVSSTSGTSASSPRIPGTQSQQGVRPRTAIPSVMGHSRPELTRPAQSPQQRRSDPAHLAADSNTWLKKAAITAAGLFVVSLLGPDYGITIPILSDLASSIVGNASEARLVLQGNSKDVVVTLNGQPVSKSLPYTVSGVPVGSPFQIQVSGPQGRFAQEFTLKKGEKRAVEVLFADHSTDNSIDPFATAAHGGVQVISGGDPSKAITLRLNIAPGGGGIALSLNGQKLDAENPLVQVPLDAPLELVADRAGYKPFRREFVLDSQQLSGIKEWLVDVQLEPAHFGYLTIRTTPSADAVIMIDGKPWIRKTPLENEKLPVGSYSIRLVNDVLGMEKSVTVNVSEGRAIQLDERLGVRNVAGEQSPQ